MIMAARLTAYLRVSILSWIPLELLDCDQIKVSSIQWRREELRIGGGYFEFGRKYENFRNWENAEKVFNLKIIEYI